MAVNILYARDIAPCGLFPGLLLRWFLGSRNLLEHYLEARFLLLDSYYGVRSRSRYEIPPDQS